MTSITVTEQISVMSLGAISADRENELIYRLFGEAAREGVVIDMISRVPAAVDKTALGFTFPDEDTPKILKISNSLNGVGTPIVSGGNVKLVVKSEEMVNGTGFAEKVFEALHYANASPLLITTALDEISVVVRESDSAELERALRKLF